MVEEKYSQSTLQKNEKVIYKNMSKSKDLRETAVAYKKAGHILSLILTNQIAKFIFPILSELYILTGVRLYNFKFAITLELFRPFLSTQFSGLNDFEAPTTN